MEDAARLALTRLAGEQGTSLSALSRMLGRNVAYLGQYVHRGTPRILPEADRRALADFLGVSEEVLGAPARAAPETAAVPYLTVAAAAGAGRRSDDERVIRHEHFARATLRAAGVSPAGASIIRVSGDSMAPGLCDGDRLLVDRDDRRVPAGGGVFVIRLDDLLAVKRLVPRGSTLEVRSDNPAYPSQDLAAAQVEVIGRARLLLRDLAG